MKRYIDADALIEFANNTKDGNIDANDIARFPVSDVVPKFMYDALCMSDVVPKYNYDVINKRLQHLLKSKFISSFDKVKLFSCGEEYVRNIEEADAFIEVLKSYVSTDSDLLRNYAAVFSDFIERTK